MQVTLVSATDYVGYNSTQIHRVSIQIESPKIESTQIDSSQIESTKIKSTGILSTDKRFDQLPFHPQLLRAVDRQGLIELTEVQRQSIPPVRDGHDVQVCAETGSGKTLAFLLPCLQGLLDANTRADGPRMLVLCPTRELARQVFKQAEKLCASTPLRSVAIVGGQEFKYQAALFRKNPDIVVATPGRFLEHLERESCDVNSLQYLVLDEADRMLDMGFGDDVLRIAHSSASEDRQTLLFSATLNHRGIRGMSSQIQQQAREIHLAAENTIANIRQEIVLADDEKHKNRLLQKLLTDEKYDRAVVFANTRDSAKRIDGMLRYHRFRVAVIHSELEQDQRNLVLQRLRDGKVDILVATDVAARGLDVEGIDLVINYDMTRSGDEHVHRVGRTGRAGASGLAISFVCGHEWNLMNGIRRYLDVEFHTRKVAGLEGKFKGPKRTKSSGKTAGKGGHKKKVKGKNKAAGQQKRKGSAAKKSSLAQELGDGFAPLKRKRDQSP